MMDWTLEPLGSLGSFSCCGRGYEGSLCYHEIAPSVGMLLRLEYLFRFPAYQVWPGARVFFALNLFELVRLARSDGFLVGLP